MRIEIQATFETERNKFFVRARMKNAFKSRKNARDKNLRANEREKKQ